MWRKIEFGHKIVVGTLALFFVSGFVGLFPSVGEAPSHIYPKEAEARLLFVGDMFFDRSVRQVANEKGYDFLLSCVKDRFASYDAVVGNLEGPITDSPSVSLGSDVGSPENFTFTFAPEVADLLKRHNVTIVDLGNNHIANQGPGGVLETEDYLAEAGVDSFGGVEMIGDIRTETGEPVFQAHIQGQDFSFVSFNEFGGASAEFVSELIADEKEQGRMVIVFAHWGDEYKGVPERVRQWARQFVQAGADLIVGSHPHVVQGKEALGNTPIYYSLGNFLFDQYWNDDVHRGLAVEAVFKDGKLEKTNEFPTEMRQDRRVCIGGDQPPTNLQPPTDN